MPDLKSNASNGALFRTFRSLRDRRDKKTLTRHLKGTSPKDLFFRYKYPKKMNQGAKFLDQAQKDDVFQELLKSSSQPNTITTETTSYERLSTLPTPAAPQYFPRGFIRNRNTNRLQRKPSMTITEVQSRPINPDSDTAMVTTTKTYQTHSLKNKPGSAKPKPATLEAFIADKMRNVLKFLSRS